MDYLVEKYNYRSSELATLLREDYKIIAFKKINPYTQILEYLSKTSYQISIIILLWIIISNCNVKILQMLVIYELLPENWQNITNMLILITIMLVSEFV